MLAAFGSFIQTDCSSGGSRVSHQNMFFFTFLKPQEWVGFFLFKKIMFWWDTLWFTGMPSFVNLAENRSKGKGFGIGQESLVFVKTVEKTWPGLGVGEGQGCRGEGVGQGPGMWSIDSIDHQKPGESCWGERGGGVWCYWSGS